MTPHYIDSVIKALNAKSIPKIEYLQELWSGYGEIVRLSLEGADAESVIAKCVKFGSVKNHPRGWNTKVSHTRKHKSYQVEQAWYKHYSAKCDDFCRVPKFYSCTIENDGLLLLLEDLKYSGYPLLKSQLTKYELFTCVEWLANFHATFLFHEPEHIWPKGTYWHLDTRRDEYEAMIDWEVKSIAKDIENRLQACKFQTFVHGDAKVANFCFSKDSKRVAAVDFQYVGRGCGMKDLAYLMGSCLDEDECFDWEGEILNHYFISFEKSVLEKGLNVDLEALEVEWRELFPIAWTDFTRFLLGWMPGHHKINSYSKMLTKRSVLILNNA